MGRKHDSPGIHPTHLRLWVIRPVLKELGLWSPSAEELLVGTAAVESGCGRYLAQLGGGPALGVYQIEPSTYAWLMAWVTSRPDLNVRVHGLAAPRFGVEQLTWNLGLGTAVARLRYLVVPEPLPHDRDIEGLAKYWKTHYNTPKGRGTPEDFVRAYKEALSV